MIRAVSQTSRLVILALVLTTATGCESVRAFLKPYVCDCARNPSAQNCAKPTQDNKAAEDATPMLAALAASHEATTTAMDVARAETNPQDDDAQPALRTIARDNAPAEPQGDPLDVVDPRVAGARVANNDAAAFDRLQEQFGVDLGDDAHTAVFTGNFSSNEGDELVVVKPGKEIEVYGAQERIAHVALHGDATPKALAALKLDKAKSIEAVRLVQDGTLQLMLHWREKDEQGNYAYKVGVFKVIGSYIGRIFVRTLAMSDAKGKVRRTGTFEVLRGKKSRFIRWIPANDAGELLTDQAVVLRWNHWEGVFRVPKPPPTAPKHLHASTARPEHHAALAECSACLNPAR